MRQYVDRDAVLRLLVVARDREKVRQIPTADVEPVRHGRWLLEPTNPYDDPGYKNRMIKVCSCCHWSNACKYNYCPNCGAKMDGEEAEHG